MSLYHTEAHQDYIDMVLVFLALELESMGFWIQGCDEEWEIGFQPLTVGG
jgi:hypothetical protein